MNILILFPLENNYLSVYFVSFILGFILGSIPFGYIIAHIKKIDIRNFGSKNIGFTNVHRTLGLLYAVPVLTLDIAKGFLPTIFATQLGFIPTIVGLGAVLGHVLTPWLAFKGGKGVATTIGVMLALAPKALIISSLILLVVLLISSYMSLASLSFALSLPILVFFLYNEHKFLLVSTAIIAVLIIIRHKDNIVRLAQKTESKTPLLKLLKNRI